MNFIRIATVLVCACAAFPAVSSAALLLATGAPEVSYNLFFDGISFSNPDVRGTALLTDVATFQSALLTDGGAPGSPNSTLIGAAAGEFLFVSFDFTTATLDPSLTLATISGIGTPVTPITNPALAAMVGAIDYRFRFARFTDIGGGLFVASYTLFEAGNPIPEPGSVQLMGLAGLVGVGFVVAKRRRLAA